MSAKGELTAEQFAQRAIELNLLDDRQLQQVWSSFGRQDVPCDEFVKHLLRQELMTNYQVERLQKGERFGFFYGDYKVLYLVSAGSFARVYRAAHKDTGQVVAVKVLRKRYSDNPDEVDKFYREGEMGRTLRDPNIVPIHEVVSSGRATYIVMEFVEGHNLRDFIKIRKRIEPAEAVKIMIDVLTGMHYAFGRGICHRDLKLTNILISSRGQARVIDFGLADVDERVNEDRLDDVANARTIDYAGLERATGVRSGDQRSDMYFLGAILYHLVTGTPPLQETRDRIQRLSRQRYADVVPIHRADPDLPRVLCMIVNRAMELDPEKRYQTPSEMLVDLQVAARRIKEGNDIDEVPDEQDGKEPFSDAERMRWQSMLIPESQRRTLMFVESNPKMQDIFREGLKRCGYRVLLTSDPNRALARFEDDATAADCVVFSTGDLGKDALEAFNRFAAGDSTSEIPAILLLGKQQARWKAKADLSDRRIVLVMPIKLRRLRKSLAKLVPPADVASQ